KRTLQETAKQRKPDSSYMYSKQPPNLGPYATYMDQYKNWAGYGLWGEEKFFKYMEQVTFIADLPGTLGRSQACNAALRLWGDEQITDEVLKTWLQSLILRNQWLDMARKMPGTHNVAFAGVAPYFYYFGHYYAGVCIGLLPAAERAPFQDGLARIILSHQEEDGSWFDWPLHNYHKPYGTAFALMTLQACRKQAIDK